MSEEMEGAAAEAKYLPVRVTLALENGKMEEQRTSVPWDWVDELAFGGKGFLVTFRLLPALEKLESAKGIKGKKKPVLADYAGAIVQVSFGEVSEAALGQEPPFDPPYIGKGAGE